MQCAVEEPRDLTLRAEVITLGSRAVVRLKKGIVLLGYFGSPEEMIQALEGQGLSLADVELVEWRRKL